MLFGDFDATFIICKLWKQCDKEGNTIINDYMKLCLLEASNIYLKSWFNIKSDFLL